MVRDLQCFFSLPIQVFVLPVSIHSGFFTFYLPLSVGWWKCSFALWKCGYELPNQSISPVQAAQLWYGLRPATVIWAAAPNCDTRFRTLSSDSVFPVPHVRTSGFVWSLAIVVSDESKINFLSFHFPLVCCNHLSEFLRGSFRRLELSCLLT